MADLKGTSITWLGHATVLIVTPKKTTILIDPFIEHNPKYPKGYKLPGKIDLLLLTHGHMDHIADALPVAKQHGPHVFGMVEVIGWLESKGLDGRKSAGMNIGGSHTHADVTFTLTEARHSSSMEDGGTSCRNAALSRRSSRPSASSTLISGSRCRLPTSKSLKSCAGVIFTAPEPFSGSA